VLGQLRLSLVARGLRRFGAPVAVLLVVLLAAAPALASSSASRTPRNRAVKNRAHAKSRSQAENANHVTKRAKPKSKKRAKPKSGRHTASADKQPQVLAAPDQYAVLNDKTLSVSSSLGVLANDSDAARYSLSVDRLNGKGGAPPLKLTTANGGTVSMSANGSFTYDPSAKLATLPSGALVFDWFTYRAADGHGGSATATVLVIIVGTFVPPSLSGVETPALSYDAGDPAVAVSSALTVAAPSDTTLAGATVKISSGFVSGQDLLSFANQNGITGSYNAGTGVLTLSGTASLADYQAALRSVKFSDPDGTNPTTGNRSVSFQVNDGRPTSNLSNVVSRTVTVVPNPPPTAGAVSATTGYQSATDITVLSHASDPDGDTLRVASVGTSVTKGKVTINSNGTIHYDPNGQFDSLTYGKTATDTFTYKVSDGFHDSNSATVTVTITGPTIPPPALSNLETPPIFYVAGEPAVGMTSTITVADVGSTTLTGATVWVSSGFASGQDLLLFTNQNGITGSYATGVLTLSGTESLADYQAALRSITFADPDGTNPSTGDRTVSFQVNDGRPVDNLSVPVTRDVTVAPNSPPTAGSVTASTGKHSTVKIAVLGAASDPDHDTVSLVSVDTTGTKGSVTMNPDGTVTYDPNGQFESLNVGQSASDTFTYTVTDGFHHSSPGTVTVTITGSNDPPVLAGIETSALSYDAGDPAVAVSSSLTASDPDDSSLAGATVAITSGFVTGEDVLSFTNQNGITGSYNASTGVLTLSGTDTVAHYQAALRSVTYSDPHGTNPTTGDRTISFVVNDGHSSNNLSAGPVSRTITVAPNPPPVAHAVSAFTGKHDSVVIPVLDSASDPDHDTVTLVSVNTTGTEGSVKINSDGTVTYDPNGQFESLTAGQSASDTFTYTVSDGFHDSSPATVTVTVNGANDPPVLAGIESSDLDYDAGTTAVPVTSDLTITAPDGYASLSGATVTISSGFKSGEDVLSFTNQSGITGSYNSLTGVLTLSGTALVAAYQTALQSVTYSDPDGSNPTTGDRSISFQVDDGRADGNLSNTVSRTVTVAPNPPPLVGSVSATTDYQTAIDITVLTHASGPPGDPLSVASVGTSATKGKVTINSDGTIHYDPNGQFDSLQYGQTATDTFTYEVSDGFHDSSAATVTVTITGPTTAAPVLAGIETSDVDYVSGEAPVPVTSALTITAPDGYATLAGATVTVGSEPAAAEDVLSFTNQSGITGSYNASAGVLTLTGIAPVAAYQTALRSVTYSDPDGINPTTGPRTVSFGVDDGRASNNLSNTVHRTVTVAANAPPTAGAVSATTGYQTATDINVLSTASDPNADKVRVASVDTTGTKGSVSINSNGTIHYDPSGQFNSLAPGTQTTDTFTYEVTDGFHDSAPETVTVTVTRPQAPVLANIESPALSYRAQDPAVAITSAITVSDTGTANLTGATVSIGSGFDSGADELSFTTQNGITASYDLSTGVLTLTGTASLADYQAALRTVAFSSSDSSASPATRTIDFQVTDADSATSTTVSRQIDVSEANQAPTAVGHSYTAVGNTPLAVGTSPSGPAASVTGTLLTGDSDSDSSDSISVSGNTNPAHGSVTVNSDGTFTYTPNAGYSGADSFQYTVIDSNDAGNPKTATATVTITVGPVVWYVDDSQTSAGNGKADSPFNTLAAANSAAQANSIVFLYHGNATYTGGATLQSGEELLGQPYGLTVDGYTLVSPGSSNPTVTNASGDGIDLATGANVEAVNVSSPSVNGITADGIGAATVGGTDAVAISGAGGDGIHISGGSGTLNFGTTSVTGSGGHSVSISGRTGGTTTIGGSVSDSALGISLASNTGATIDFTGKLTASTGANAAFTAIGGGTVTAIGSGSTLTTTTGTALDVENTTIGFNGLKFQSISAGTTSGGPASGIDLNNTGTSGGGLSVTGTGSTAAGGDGSGGTIQQTTSGGASAFGQSDGGVYLNDTNDISLADMDFASNNANGVYGTAVDGLILSSDTFTSNGTNVTTNDSGLLVDGLTGIGQITNTNISGSEKDNARIFGGVGGTTLSLTVTGSSFSGPHTPGGGSDSPSCKAASRDQGDGLLVEPRDGNVSVNATSDTFQGNYDNGLEVQGAGDVNDAATIGLTAEHNTVSNNCGAGIVLADSAASSPAGTSTIDSNTIDGQQGDGIDVSNLGGGTWTGHVDSNTIGNVNAVNSGSLAGSGIDVDDEAAQHAGTLTVDVSSNTIRQIASAFGIKGTADNGASTLNLTLTGNTIRTDQPNSQDGITVQSGANASDTSLVCLNATGNTSVSSGTGAAQGYDAVGMSVGEFDPTPNATFDIQGPGADDVVSVEAYLNAHNTLGGTDHATSDFDQALAQFEGKVGLATCPTAP
jgi:VCBS repeat-containing protein